MTDTEVAPESGGALGDGEAAFIAKMVERESAPRKPNEDDAPAPVEGEEAAEENQPVDEAEAEPEEAEAEKAEEPEAEEPKDPIIEFTVDGKTERIPLTELQKGYSRQADYSRKTAELAQERTQLNSEREHYAQNLKAFNQQQDTALSHAERQLAADADWLKANDPATYALRKMEIQDAREALQKKQAEQGWVEQAIQSHAQTKRGEFLIEQSKKLAKKLPEYADGKKRDTFVKGLVEYLGADETGGFTPEEIDTLRDHRLVILVDKARKYDALKGGKALADKKVENAPRVIKPGQAQVATGAGRQMTDARKALKQRGDDDSAIAFFKSLQ